MPLLAVTFLEQLDIMGERIMSDEWKFDQPPNCGVITLHSIINGDEPILYVSHDADDHGWQFLSGGNVDMKNAALFSLGSMVKPMLDGDSNIDIFAVGARGSRFVAV